MLNSIFNSTVSYLDLVIKGIDNIEIFFLIVNLVVLALSKFIFKFLYSDMPEKAKPRFKIASFLSGLLFIIQVLHLLMNGNEEHFIVLQSAYTVITMYGSLFLQSFSHYFIKKQYGSKTLIDKKEVFVDTSGSRIWTVVSVIFISTGLVWGLIKIWSAEYLMETTGLVGLIAVALALTNAVWFPDIYRGILALKAKVADIGDTIMIESIEGKRELIVKNNGFFKLTCYDIINNHQVFIWNNILTNQSVHNLTRIAGSSGLRKNITFNIGYPEMDETLPENFSKKERDILENKYNGNIPLYKINDYIDSFRNMTAEVYENVKMNDKITIKEIPFVARVKNTGDYAIEMNVSYYLGKLPRTEMTEVIRSYLIYSEYSIMEEFLKLSYKYKIPLQTEDLVIYEKRTPSNTCSFKAKDKNKEASN